MHSINRPTSRRKRLPVIGFIVTQVVGLVAVGLVHSPRPTFAAESATIEQLDTFPRMPADAIAAFGEDKIVPPDFYKPPATSTRIHAANATGGTLLGLPLARQIWQFFPFVDFSGRTGIVVRDAASLRAQHTFVLNHDLARGAFAALGGEWMHAVDGGKRLFLVASDQNTVLEFDLATLEHKTFSLGPRFRTCGWGSNVILLGGLTYDAKTDSLLALFGGFAGNNAGNTNTCLWTFNLGSSTGEARVVRSCNGPLPSTDQSTTYAIPILIRPDHLYVPCQRAGNVAAVVRLPRASVSSPHGVEDLVIGPVYLESTLVDQGSGRLFLQTTLGEIWVFEADSMSFVGVVAAHAEVKSSVSIGTGLDIESGRLYFQSGTYGLGVAEGRFFPIPQARTLPGDVAQGQERIVSDRASNRFYVLRGAGTAKEVFYRVYTAGPAPEPAPPPDPDRNTVDRPEKDGETETKYFATGTGYGMRVLLAKGISTIAPAPTVGVVSPTAQVINDHVNSKCGYTDRELVAGRVGKAEYDTGSTAASAIAFDVDVRTQLDLERRSRCDATVKDPNGTDVFLGIFSTSPTAEQLAPYDQGEGWKYAPATCSSSVGSSIEEPAKHGDTRFGDSTVTCPEPGKKLEGYAEAEMQGGVAVGKAWTRTEIERRSTGAIVARVESKAQDVRIGQGPASITIREISSVALSTATGRPRADDMSTHTTYLKGVTIAGTTLCEDDCDSASVVDALNQAASGRAQFRVASGIDERLRKGTPRGALTAVQKSVPRQASDQALIGDFTTEVPGFEMITYNDNAKFGRARQLYQFAGVSTAATYNITPLPTEFGFPDDPGFTEGDFEVADGPVDDVLSNVDDLPGVLSSAEGEGAGSNFFERAVSALLRGIRLFLTNPRQALLLFTAWCLFCLPLVLSRRRRLLAAARSD